MYTKLIYFTLTDHVLRVAIYCHKMELYIHDCNQFSMDWIMSIRLQSIYLKMDLGIYYCIVFYIRWISVYKIEIYLHKMNLCIHDCIQLYSQLRHQEHISIDFVFATTSFEHIYTTTYASKINNKPLYLDGFGGFSHKKRVVFLCIIFCNSGAPWRIICRQIQQNGNAQSDRNE